MLVYNSSSKFISLFNLSFFDREFIFPLEHQPIFIKFLNDLPVFLAGFIIDGSSTFIFYELDWLDGIYVKAINLYGSLAERGPFIPKNACFSSDNSRLALIMTV